ncbi:MAG: PqqD family protein [Planctomycetota bacterium]
MAKTLPPSMVVVRKVDWREKEEKVVLLPSRFGAGYAGRILRRVFGDLKLRLNLDDLGSHVWKACDGAASLEKITASLEKTFQDEATGAGERVERFLRELHRNGWVEFFVPEGAETSRL